MDTAFKRQPYTAEQADAHQWATLCKVECRGCEMVEFDPQRVRFFSRQRLFILPGGHSDDMESSRQRQQYQV